MTTATKPLPDYIDSVQKDAAAMGWDVERTTVSIKLTPPNGGKKQMIALSLNPSPPPVQMRKQLELAGFYKALGQWEREQKAPKQTPEAKTRADGLPLPDADGMLVCPECVRKGVKEPFKSRHPQGMGAHRKREHDVPGKYREGRSGTSKPQAAAKKAAPAAPAQAAPAKKTVPAQAAPAAPEVRAKAADALPDPVTKALNVLHDAVKQASGDTTALRQENEALRKENSALREFRDKVVALASDGTKAPVQVVSSILDLAKQTDQ